MKRPKLKMPGSMKRAMESLAAAASSVPAAGWLAGALVSALLEFFIGGMVAPLLGLSKIPVLFGILLILKDPALLPGALGYVLLIYCFPILAVALATRRIANRLAVNLEKLPGPLNAIVHIALCYAVLHLWAGMNDYRVLIVKMTLISVILTLSINVINGYMGEFSCSHPGFMAVGAYASSIITVALFTGEKTLGMGLLPESLGPLLFPLVLVAAGLVTAGSSLVIAIPSFRTRGDYLAIISLAFLFIVKSVIENLEIVGGPRGLGGQPYFSSLPVVFIWTILCIWTVNNFVSSVFGKALNAVRDNEAAADAMTVDTRRTKITAFMFGAFWAGIAGGLFAHELRYVNPGTFGLQKLAEILAMVYFGGLNSIYGSIVGALSISLLGEALRPLELYKWIVIPVILILVMVFRPSGLVSFRDLDMKKLLGPRERR